ncbi:MAG: hypothetical protein J6W82_04970 [Bacteroidales bacterium]|nr:hypothetical protein [Bacteroidales bacterium]
MDRMTQLRRALAMLRENGSVTAGELMTDAGMCSPRKRISELKRSTMLAGYEIQDQWEEGHNRYGEPVRYKRYFLIKKGVAQ